MSSWREFRVKTKSPATLVGLFVSLIGVLLLAHAFYFLHYIFGPRVMLCILGWGTIVTILFVLRRSTKASFHLHLTNNAIVYVLLPSIWPWR